MKKIFCIIGCVFILLTLSSCNKYDISKILFIASVGIESTEEGYQGYFYLPLSSDIGKTESTENKGKGEYAKTSGKTIAELFNNIQAGTSLIVNFKHVSSIVINDQLLNKPFLEELLDYIKYSLEIDFNCYIFITQEKMNDLFDFQNPNQESVLNSLLVSTNDADSTFLVTQPIHFLEFVREFYKDRSILLPLLVLEEIWTIDGETVKNFHAQSGVYYYKENLKFVIQNPSSPYFSDTKSFFDKIEKTSIRINHYKWKLDFKEVLYMNVDFDYDVYDSGPRQIKKEDVEGLVQKRLTDYLQEFQEMDPLNLQYLNYAYNTSCSYDTMEIQIHIHSN